MDDTILNTTAVVDPPIAIPGSSPSTSAKTDNGKLSTFPTLGQGLLFEGRKVALDSLYSLTRYFAPLLPSWPIFYIEPLHGILS